MSAATTAAVIAAGSCHHEPLTQESAGLMLACIVVGAGVGMLFAWARMEDDYIGSAILGVLASIAAVAFASLVAAAFGFGA